MVRGAIQVPPNGQPVLFLNDHPVTGGYPVIGVVAVRPRRPSRPAPTRAESAIPMGAEVTKPPDLQRGTRRRAR